MKHARYVRLTGAVLMTTLTLFRSGTLADKAVIDLKGAGASFPNEVYQAWMTYYTSIRMPYVSLHITYDAVGSGAGKRRITGVDGPPVDYGGSDSLLSQEVKDNFPDITMFPTMAGAVVLGYNIPELKTRLVLSINTLVGIYSGSITHWDHPLISSLNPGSFLPNARIKVLARADKSGTTSIFTSALSNEKCWRENFGIFSSGQSGSKWPNETITYYAHQNRGMSGLILSFSHSIGYISIADAKESDMSFALLQTDNETVVEANMSTVQVAMEEAAKHLSGSTELTTSLAQYSNTKSYPIAGLTYMIVFLTSMKNCDVGVELVRYINWFLTSKAASNICLENNMTPLPSELADIVRTKIVKKMSCRGKNLWKEALEQIAYENRKDNTLMEVSVGLVVGVLSGICLGVVLYFLTKRIQFLKKLSKREWEVNIEDITFYQATRSGDDDEERFVLWPSLTSLTEVDQIEDGFMILEHVLHWPGKWQGITVGLRLLEIKNLKTSSQATQTTLLWLKDINHTNILKFYGIASLDQNHFMVSDYCSKGSLSQMLKDRKLNLSNGFKFALSLDVANGMAFLHSKNIIHGHLKSTNCLLDLKWTVKISDWEFNRLYQGIEKNKCFLLMIHHTAAEVGADEAAMQELWTAPEILKSDFTQHPTFESDAYSLGIVLFEIFSRDSPYSEHFSQLPASEILSAVVNNNLRPREDDMTPNSVRMVMDLTWSAEPSKRPTMDQVVKLLRGAHNIKKSVVDAMLEVTEEYTRVLQSRLKSTTRKLGQTQRTLRTLVGHHVPHPFLDYVTEKLMAPGRSHSRDSVQYTITQTASILCIRCTTHADPKTQWTIFNNLDLLLSQLQHSYGGTRVDIALGTFLVIFLDPEQDVVDTPINGRTSAKRDNSSSTAADTMSLSALSSTSEVYSISSAPITSWSKTRTEENCGPAAILPHVEAAADFSVQLIRSSREVFITADGTQLGALFSAIHTGPVDMYLLDNAMPKCLFCGPTLDVVRTMVNHSASDRVLVSDVYRQAVIGEGLAYEFEPSVKINGKISATFWLSEKQPEVETAKQLSYLPIIV